MIDRGDILGQRGPGCRVRRAAACKRLCDRLLQRQRSARRRGIFQRDLPKRRACGVLGPRELCTQNGRLHEANSLVERLHGRQQAGRVSHPPGRQGYLGDTPKAAADVESLAEVPPSGEALAVQWQGGCQVVSLKRKVGEVAERGREPPGMRQPPPDGQSLLVIRRGSLQVP